MKFAIDLDGVLANFTAQVTKVANELWPGKIPEGFAPDNWDYVGTLTKSEWSEIWVRIKQTPYFWEDEPPLSGVDELQEFIYGRPGVTKDEIFFITARAVTVGDGPLAQSSQWLNRYGLWPRKGLSTVIPVAQAAHKKDLFRGLGIKFMLDDYAPTIKELNEIEGMHAYVLDQPHNRYMTDIPRVFSVAEYLETIHTIHKI
jgi:5' nucleotidase, deoxy (Pyrimidine), cytosolic type C protein (NT5C)